jgi:hypothetical protein
MYVGRLYSSPNLGRYGGQTLQVINVSKKPLEFIFKPEALDLNLLVSLLLLGNHISRDAVWCGVHEHMHGEQSSPK